MPGERNAPSTPPAPRAPPPSSRNASRRGAGAEDDAAGARRVWASVSEARHAASRLLERHGKKLWWLHSAYALGLGISVVLFAQKRFEHARWLAVSLGFAWLLVVLFFRIFGSGDERERGELLARGTRSGRLGSPRLRFFVMSYALKNLYQGMLFFLLPFYWKACTLDAPNVAFVVVLGACALLSTLDLVFDRVLLRFRVLASLFHALTLFACINLVVPALFPNTRSLASLVCSAGLSVVSFWTLHVRVSAMKKRVNVALLAASLMAGAGLAYATRVLIPPVPMYLASAAVGPQVLPDGRLAMEVRSLNAAVIRQLLAVTDVVVPGGQGDRLFHVWRRDGVEVHRATEDTSRVEGPDSAVRLRSSLTEGAISAGGTAPLAGHWTVDVETEDGQLVGRVAFRVTE